MRKAVQLGIVLVLTLPVQSQTADTLPRTVTAASKPKCSQGAICFSGQVLQSETFHRSLNDNLEFVMEAGWTIAIVPKHPQQDCNEFTSVVNPPYRSHRSLDIDTSYGWTAEQEVTTSPREFRFVTNCADNQTESNRLDTVLWPYTATDRKQKEALAKLGTSKLGTGRLWITDSKISHADDTADEKLGTIVWMKFTAEIRLP